MKKKIYQVTGLIFSLLIMLECAAFASAMPPIVDQAGYLNDSELTELSKMLQNLRSAYNMDVAVVIEDRMSGYDEESTADDIFDYNEYGMGDGKDGILLYISREPRKYHYTTHGYAETVFNERGLRHIDNEVLPYLRDNDYYSALYAYAVTAEEILTAAASGERYNGTDGMTMLIVAAAVIIAPILIAAFMTSGKLKKMKTARPENYADSYMKRDSMRLNVSRDIFLYSVVNRRERPKSSSGGHTSSSGEHHGGRGGSY